MPIAYPETWSSLTYPERRAELLSYLKDCADKNLYRMCEEVEFAMHFVFDDSATLFSPDPANAIGQALFDEDEAAALLPFVAAFDHALGPRSKKLSQISAGEWSSVASAAREAYATLIQKGQPVYGTEDKKT